MSGRSDLVLIGAGAQAWVATVVNMPHFMASYRLVYRSKETILRHKWASIYIPAILAAYIVVAVWDALTTGFGEDSDARTAPAEDDTVTTLARSSEETTTSSRIHAPRSGNLSRYFNSSIETTIWAFVE